MPITIEVPDELAARVQRLAGQAFAADVNEVAIAALEYYATTQELLEQLLANPPVAVVEEPQLVIDPNALLKQAGAQDASAQDVITGEVTLPEEVVDAIREMLGGIDVGEALSGRLTVSPEAAADLPADVVVAQTDVVALQPAPPAPVSEEERVAQVLAASGASPEQITSAAEGFRRILARVEELRSR